MRFNRFSRRYFLQGLGVSLALPYLPSVMPQAYAQNVPGGVPLRYVQFTSSYGQYGTQFWPSDVGLAATPSGIFARPFSAVAGNVSNVLGAAFNPFKAKMSVIRGLNVLAGSNLHNGSYPTCASGTPEDNIDNGRPEFSYSVDSVLSESAKVYPDATGKQRIVNFCPAPEPYDNYSWTVRNGAKEHIASTTTTAALLAKFTNFSAPAAPADPVKARKLSAIQGVFGDYKSLRDSGKLSAVDKTRLEQYIALIDTTEKGLAATATAVACAAPGQEAEAANKDAMHRNQANILASALACDLTRVASYVLAVLIDRELMHTWAHDGFQAEHAGAQRVLGEKLAYFLTKLDSITEANGKTLLDNTLIMWSNEYGDIDAGAHTGVNMPVVVFGGGGKLQLGQYIDYRKTGFMPYNNLLVTFMNSLGLTSADYERGGVIGFGEYNSGAITNYNFAAKTTTAERRKALPYLYKGTIMG